MIEALIPAQRAALDLLAQVLDPDAFYLAGGVAVALHRHHRQSHDLDLFTSALDPPTLAEALGSAGIRVISRVNGTLHLDVNGIPTSLLRYRYPLIAPLERFTAVPVPIASSADLACMKLSAIAGRGAARDFWDLHTRFTAPERGLAQALADYQVKYAHEDIGHIVRSLVYFADAEGEPMPAGLTASHWQQIRSDLMAWIHAL